MEIIIKNITTVGELRKALKCVKPNVKIRITGLYAADTDEIEEIELVENGKILEMRTALCTG